MAQVENAPPSIAIKLVFCGPFGSGKTTNLHQIYARLSDRYRSRMLSLDPSDTSDEELLFHTNPIDIAHRPTLFFDLLPIVLNIAGLRVVLRLLAGPGHAMHEHTRRLILRGADGIVFVADSERSPDENDQSLVSVRTSLRDNGLAPDTLPMVIQLNKRDSISMRTDGVAAKRLLGHRADVHIVPAVAKSGHGVLETIMRLIAVVWPALLHEHDGLAASSLDLTTLLTELGRRLNAVELARALTAPPAAASSSEMPESVASRPAAPVLAPAHQGAALR